MISSEKDPMGSFLLVFLHDNILVMTHKAWYYNIDVVCRRMRRDMMIREDIVWISLY